MADDVRSGAGRKDEVGRSGIYPATGPYPPGDAPVITPGEINKEATPPSSSQVQQSDDIKGATRLPRFGDEE